jgi:hypothetical protein
MKIFLGSIFLNLPFYGCMNNTEKMLIPDHKNHWIWICFLKYDIYFKDLNASHSSLFCTIMIQYKSNTKNKIKFYMIYMRLYLLYV